MSNFRTPLKGTRRRAASAIAAAEGRPASGRYEGPGEKHLLGGGSEANSLGGTEGTQSRRGEELYTEWSHMVGGFLTPRRRKTEIQSKISSRLFNEFQSKISSWCCRSPFMRRHTYAHTRTRKLGTRPPKSYLWSDKFTHLKRKLKGTSRGRSKERKIRW